MKSRFLTKVLALILLALLLTVVLTNIVFTYTSRNVFAKMKADEMIPRAEFIGDLTRWYQRGEISLRTYQELTIDDTRYLDALLYVFRANGMVFMRPDTEIGQRNAAMLSAYLPEVCDGETIVIPSKGDIGIIVGVPVTETDGTVIGAVFLTKPLGEVNAALSGLNTALIISMLAVALLMILPTYLGTKSITKPLKQMSMIARTMAEGDFSIRADVKSKDEVGQLGQALNFLSGKLSHTIKDLILERNRLRSILNGLHEGIIALDAQANITHYNPAALRLLHCETQEQLRQSEPLEQLVANLSPQSTQAVQTSDFTIGQAVIHITVTRLENDGGQFTGMVVLLQDVTEAERLEQTRRDYVANVSHELRTPIASIRGLADALNDGLIKKEEDKCRYYGYILRESMRLSRLINDLLELSRLQSGNIALEKSKFDMRALLFDLNERFSVTANDSDLTLRMETSADRTKVLANEDRVEQVLVALIDNAIKYTQDNGTITLSLDEWNEKLLVSVRNTGTIDQNDLPHLFDRFYKVDKAHVGQGTGLGLSIAKEIMTLMGESIWVENKNGEVVFSFTLTLAQS